MSTLLIRNAKLVNEGKIFDADVLIKNNFIEKIEPNGISGSADKIIEAEGLHLLPGIIDDQVHFREPGLTHKGTIYSESKAAVAGGVTGFMDMPNTIPNAVTKEILEEKYSIASRTSLANYSFFMGATNKNLDELMKIDRTKICGVKIFMGSSTGDMLVDDHQSLENIFKNVESLIAVHCEDDPMIKENQKKIIEQFGENITAKYHPLIRTDEACFMSSSFAVELAKKYNTQLHILHLSSKKELALLRNDIPLSQKRITAEACVHHLWFSDDDYEAKGNLIKWNPSIKTREDREALFSAILDGTIDIIATDHAPHSLEEKNLPYLKAPSGGPLIQHSLNVMLEFYQNGKISLEKIVETMSHKVAELYRIDRRGFIREGYYADLVLVDLDKKNTVAKNNILYNCGWSPFEGTTFHSQVTHTLVNGNLVFGNGIFDESQKGMRLNFNR
ncbi:MAG: dihydroorotase [Bacteroidia bacterium]